MIILILDQPWINDLFKQSITLFTQVTQDDKQKDDKQKDDKQKDVSPIHLL